MHYLSYVSLAVYFIAMLAIGLFAYKQSTSDVSGYILGGRKVSPQVTALSAGASDMSGWMLMGLPGAMFLVGFETIYIALGLLLGALINYLIVAPKLRVYTEVADNALTIPEFFAKRFHAPSSNIRIIAAVIIVIFFTLYTSAGLVAGGKLFESAFGLNYELGLVITLGVVVSYTLLGGFLAVSLTDFVQGCIMFVALILVPVVAYQEFSNADKMMNFAYESIPHFGEAMQNVTLLGLISSLSWGLGYFGQPHIIVRFMAIRCVSDIKMAKNIGMSWMMVTIVGALATGLVGIAYANKFEMKLSDPETIFIVFSELLFHPMISGFLLAAILAAIMSTISSQLLVSSSSLTEDIYRVVSKREATEKQMVAMGRYGVAGVAIVASVLAMDRSNSILSLVSNAWAGFGAAFGPLILFSLYKRNLTHKAAIVGIVSGAATVLFWIYAPVLANGQALTSVIYEMIPGFLVSSAAIWITSALDSEPCENTVDTFNKAGRVLAEQR
ncbi:sodium/proline symporter PutP [Shewanella colwelliana]|uniref:Sodium/proline symporter n=1 Tax=Shewanella colwelliana TaxID=23 RepID=A0A1E5IR41_SHECO|nr:sodium/proline symporter PutP [Shewanella colwelliana]MDX1282690.1 sodium/proline symporter PutP [Shewanella colwelliana]OEG72995.1 sodium/proline symporter [Shewanella colwelliana]GIU40038.1 osmoregulated proline transporter OpuE [Shewanella colwelliana]